MKVRDLKIGNVITTREETTIEDAIRILHKKRVGALVITDDKRKCKGIFTERDALRAVARRIPLEKHLGSLMSKNVLTIGEGASFTQARRLMILHNIRHLPVMDEKGSLVGMLTLRRILDELVGMPTAKG